MQPEPQKKDTLRGDGLARPACHVHGWSAELVLPSALQAGPGWRPVCAVTALAVRHDLLEQATELLCANAPTTNPGPGVAF